MKQKYLLALIGYTCFLWTTGLANAQNMTTLYTGGGAVTINVSDGKKNYEFSAPEIQGRYNPQQKRFEFLLPLAPVETRHNQSFLLSLFNAIFHPDQTKDLQMYVYLPNEMKNFQDFVNPKTLQLKGQVYIAGKMYSLPVNMSLKYSNQTLYYGFQGNVLSDFGMITASANEKPVRPTEIQFLVKEGPMGIVIEQ